MMTMLPTRFSRVSSSVLALTAVLAIGGCTTVEDTWDSTWNAVFGDDASAAASTTASASDEGTAQASEANSASDAAPPTAEAAAPAEGLPGSARRAYDDGVSRRAPTVRHALVEETEAAPRQVAQSAPPISRETVRAPAPHVEQETAVAPTVPMTSASGDALAGSPAPTPLAAPSAPMTPPSMGQDLLIAPPPGSGGMMAYGDDSAANGLGTTVIDGDGSVAIEPYVPVDYVADGGYGGYGGPVSMDAFNPAGAGVSTLVATIQFGHGSHSLSAHDRKILRQVVELQKQYGGMVRVVGHASSRTANMTMDQHMMVNFDTSAARARAVVSALSDMGVPQGQIFSAAVSDNEPIYFEVMPSGEAGNRRAEVYLDY